MQMRQHLEFMCRADRKLPGSAPDDPEIFGILDHIYRGEVTWLRRVPGDAAAQLAGTASAGNPEQLRALWPEVHRKWLGWEAPVPHEDSRGNPL